LVQFQVEQQLAILKAVVPQADVVGTLFGIAQEGVEKTVGAIRRKDPVQGFTLKKSCKSIRIRCLHNLRVVLSSTDVGPIRRSADIDPIHEGGYLPNRRGDRRYALMAITPLR
jgi:hypothetical protein